MLFANKFLILSRPFPVNQIFPLASAFLVLLDLPGVFSKVDAKFSLRVKKSDVGFLVWFGFWLACCVSGHLECVRSRSVKNKMFFLSCWRNLGVQCKPLCRALMSH